MNDGTEAWLTQSERYYCRREPESDNWDTIFYYTLEKNKIELTKGTCKDCGETIQSKRCGHFVRCKCGNSFVDTDRWMPESGRYGGNIMWSGSEVKPNL